MAKYIDKIKVKINEDTFEEVALGTTSDLVFVGNSTLRLSEQIDNLKANVSSLREWQVVSSEQLNSLEVNILSLQEGQENFNEQLNNFNTQLEEIKTQLTDINNVLETVQSTLTKYDERLLTIETQLGIDSSEPDVPEV